LAQKRSTTGAVLFLGALVGGKAYIFGFSMMRDQSKKISKYLEQKRPTKRSKNYQKMTSLPLSGHTKVALGDSIFEGSNDLQMKKFKMLKKLDRKTFPMSYHGLNLSKGKASKSGWKATLCFWLMAPRF